MLLRTEGRQIQANALEEYFVQGQLDDYSVKDPLHLMDSMVRLHIYLRRFRNVEKKEYYVPIFWQLRHIYLYRSYKCARFQERAVRQGSDHRERIELKEGLTVRNISI